MTALQVHGSDGLGELDGLLTAAGTPRYLLARLPSVLSTAQEVWNDCVRRYPDEVTLITLGPLTNLALGLKSESLHGPEISLSDCNGGRHRRPRRYCTCRLSSIST